MKNHIKKRTHYSKRLFIIMGSLVVSLSCLVCFFYLLPQSYYKTGFKTIKDLEMCASLRDEWVKMEGINPLVPCYETYYMSASKKTWSALIGEKIRWLAVCSKAASAPLFSSTYFKTLLETVTKTRLADKWQGDFIQKIQLKAESKIISFGVMQGAFHSLVRCLRELQKLNILDENLKLTSNDYYISFNGNLINRSPYTIQILTTVLKLMEVNPKNIFYLRGEHESYDEWRLHSLKRELEVFCSHLSTKQGIPLKEEVEAFFGTLPLTLYCTIPFQKSDTLPYFRINPFFTKKHLCNAINESSYANFIAKTDEVGVSTLSLSGRSLVPEAAASAIQCKAMITEIRKRDKWETTDGLRQLPSVNGVTAWHVFSAPTQIFRDYFNFYWDAFAIITPAVTLDAWTITLHHHDMRNKDNVLFNTRSHYFFTGNQVL